MHDIWNTEIIETNGVLQGPAKIPLQMLAEQEYDGHLSIHDDQQAQNLGFQGAPIEGRPIIHSLTHYSIVYGEIDGLKSGVSVRTLKKLS